MASVDGMIEDLSAAPRAAWERGKTGSLDIPEKYVPWLLGGATLLLVLILRKRKRGKRGRR